MMSARRARVLNDPRPHWPAWVTGDGVIKYLGSKRRLAGTLADLAEATGARTAVDLFTGTTRVAQALKSRGLHVTAVDVADYSAVLAQCYVATDADDVDADELAGILADLDRLPDRDGYVTETFCRRSRFFQESNGRRIDAIRDGVEKYRGTRWYPILLTALLLAADRVDSTTGVQMAYLKQWAQRSYRPLTLAPPHLVAGSGSAIKGDALTVARGMKPVDLAYLDPPYNQHRYESNYHIWNTLVRWDDPEHYGIACKRVDLRDRSDRSPFNARASFAPALADLLAAVPARTVVLSYNNESWVGSDELLGMLHAAGHDRAALLTFDSARYVGARIGIHGPDGGKVGTVGRLRNEEWLVVAGPAAEVAAMTAAGVRHGARVATDTAELARSGRSE